MTISEADGVYILALAAPFLVVATALLTLPLVIWLERREDRRRPPRIVHLDSNVG
jgi:hypothetical protein